jgi:hypothetical protein
MPWESIFCSERFNIPIETFKKQYKSLIKNRIVTQGQKTCADKYTYIYIYIVCASGVGLICGWGGQ